MARMGPAGQTEAEEAERPTLDEPVSRTVRLPVGRDEEVAAGVHEVQNALTGVLGWVEVALGSGDPAMRERALRAIETGVYRARNLLSKLASPAERFSVRPRDFRVGPLLAETCELLHPRCSSAGVVLALHPVSSEVSAVGDPERVGQIVTNLVLNAVDAVLAVPGRESGRGRVEVGVQVEEHTVSIEVRDDGVGMDQAVLSRAFEPHFTTHPRATGPRLAGSGMGLAICRALAEAMQGRLEVQSRPGAGTTISLTLTRDAGVPEVTIPPPEEHGLRPGTRVLVVDDEPAIRELLEVALALRGAEVVAAATLAEARAALARGVFDVALVDETLGPNESGAQLVADIARTQQAVAPVLMTGAPSVDHLPPSVSRWLLRKPFSLDEVVKLLSRAMVRG